MCHLRMVYPLRCKSPCGTKHTWTKNHCIPNQQVICAGRTGNATRRIGREALEITDEPTLRWCRLFPRLVSCPIPEKKTTYHRYASEERSAHSSQLSRDTQCRPVAITWCVETLLEWTHLQEIGPSDTWLYAAEAT